MNKHKKPIKEIDDFIAKINTVGHEGVRIKMLRETIQRRNAEADKIGRKPKR